MIFLRTLVCLILLVSIGYSFELKDVPEISPTAYLKWDLGVGAIRIALDRQGSADLKFSEVEQALFGALNTWESVSNQNMRFQYSGSVSLQAASSTDRMNTIHWVENDWKYSSYALAVTSYSYYLDDPPTLVDADIFMNGQNFNWGVGSASETRVDVQQTLIHEVGHLLGISHTSVKNAQMFPYLTGSKALTKDDRAALRYLYGPHSSSFAVVSPVGHSKYAANISSRGLPLPVFRWNAGLDSNYVIEFSSTSTFSRKIKVSAGPYPFYALTPQMEKKLLALSPIDKIFWRVRSGSSVTPARSFRFI